MLGFVSSAFVVNVPGMNSGGGHERREERERDKRVCVLKDIKPLPFLDLQHKRGNTSVHPDSAVITLP